MSDPLYTSCAEVLSLAQSHKDDLNALLDPVDGFAPRLRQLCQERHVCNSRFVASRGINYHHRLVDLEANSTSVSPEELEALRMESDTWALLQTIMPYVHIFIVILS